VIETREAELLWSAYGLNWANIPDLDRALGAMAGITTEDFELRLSPELRERTIRGLKDLRAFAAAIEEDFSDCTYAARQIEEVGEGRLLVSGTISARGRLSTLPLSGSFAHLWHFDGARASRAQAYRSREEALEAAGFTPPEGS
jgi:hypothetical protein